MWLSFGPSRAPWRTRPMRVGPTVREGDESSWTLTWAGPITLSERARAGGGLSGKDLRAVADV